MAYSYTKTHIIYSTYDLKSYNNSCSIFGLCVTTFDVTNLLYRGSIIVFIYFAQNTMRKGSTEGKQMYIDIVNIFESNLVA